MAAGIPASDNARNLETRSNSASGCHAIKLRRIASSKSRHWVVITNDNQTNGVSKHLTSSTKEGLERTSLVYGYCASGKRRGPAKAGQNAPSAARDRPFRLQAKLRAASSSTVASKNARTSPAKGEPASRQEDTLRLRFGHAFEGVKSDALAWATPPVIDCPDNGESVVQPSVSATPIVSAAISAENIRHEYSLQAAIASKIDERVRKALCLDRGLPARRSDDLRSSRTIREHARDPCRANELQPSWNCGLGTLRL